MTPLIHLQGKTALITGASRGIGESIAKAFAQSGANVVITSRKEDGIKAAAERIRAAGEGYAIEPVVCHTGKPDQIDAAIEATLARFGGLDVVVNNAATNVHFGPLITADQRAFDKIIEVNLRGYFDVAKAAVKHWAGEDGVGRSIINVASIVALMSGPAQGIYAMSKAGVISMTRTLAVELGGAGIRVNAIAPGLVDTRFAAAITSNDDLRQRIVGRTCLQRHAEPDEIAGAAVFLASDAASYVTGHTLVVDGGATIYA